MDQQEWLKKNGAKSSGEELEKALGVLADNEGALKKLLVESGFRESAHTQVCHVLRKLVDGWEDVPEEDTSSPFPKEMQGEGALSRTLEREMGKTDPAKE